MSNDFHPFQRMIQTLQAHGIDYKIENGKLYAEEVYTVKFGDHVQTNSDWVDVSDFTSPQLAAWLGY